MQKKNIWKRWIAAILMVIVCFSFVPSQLYGAEDYRSWDQGDSRWGDIPIGIEGDTMESSGCLVTSVTKLIIQAGLKNQEEINPGILATWLNENGGFTDSGALYWAKPAEYVDGLSYYGSLRDYDTYDSAEYEEQIISWIEKGYHLVVCVKSGGHWVAVDEAMTLENGEVYIMDSLPGNQNADLTLKERYATFQRVSAYTGGTTPEGTQKEESPFSDVSPDRYSYDAIVWAAEKGITTGTGDGCFKPEDTCTREQVVTFLWRAMDCPEPESSEKPFPDVKDNYALKAICWATENGVTNGSDGLFKPEDYCTREQVMTFIWRTVGEPEAESDEVPFPDVSQDRYSYDAIIWAAKNGITTGDGDGNFRPEDTCTREEVVTFLYRQFQ